MSRVAGLVTYPIKGMGGVSLDRSAVAARGLAGDRRWMLVDDEGTFLSQRSLPRMCLFRPALTLAGLVVRGPGGDEIAVPPCQGERFEVTVWKSVVDATHVSGEVDLWFSERLGVNCRLVYMTDDSIRPTHPDYTHPGDIVGFADAFPVLVASLASLGDLNSRLADPLPMNRFRPNIIVEDCAPYEEDTWESFTLGGIRFRTAKACGRCQVTTTNQDTAEVGQEPLRTLATYRRDANAVYFGNYFVPEAPGEVAVGDRLEL